MIQKTGPRKGTGIWLKVAWRRHARENILDAGEEQAHRSCVPMPFRNAYVPCALPVNTYLRGMSLEEKVMESLKAAMRAKDAAAMRTLRAIKASILLFKTSGSGETLDEAAEVRMLQKMVKQRKESAAIFHTQNRPDLAMTEEEEIRILEQFLPAQLDEEALEKAIRSILVETGATTANDMGRVIGLANQRLSGQAEGRAIADTVKRLLNP